MNLNEFVAKYGQVVLLCPCMTTNVRANQGHRLDDSVYVLFLDGKLKCFKNGSVLGICSECYPRVYSSFSNLAQSGKPDRVATRPFKKPWTAIADFAKNTKFVKISKLDGDQ
jgi:hypothetical protein